MKQSSTEEYSVAKESRHDIKYNERLKFHVEAATNQLRAYKYAKSFRNMVHIKGAENDLTLPPISVLQTEVYRLKAPSCPGGFRYLSVEKQLKGPYQKWNNNDGYVNKSDCLECQLAQSFR
jgi:hypothetical protein